MNHSTNSAPAAEPDAQLERQVLIALEHQARELSHLLWRLERARNVLVPGPIDAWRGLSRIAFDSALGGLGDTINDSMTAVRSAIDCTHRAVAGMNSRG
jgi:hypothetical protein